MIDIVGAARGASAGGRVARRSAPRRRDQLRLPGNEHLNPQTGSNDFATNTQAFVALQYLIRKQLFVKLVGAYANSRFENSFTNTAPYNDEWERPPPRPVSVLKIYARDRFRYRLPRPSVYGRSESDSLSDTSIVNLRSDEPDDAFASTAGA